jgi:hypothetical protein
VREDAGPSVQARPPTRSGYGRHRIDPPFFLALSRARDNQRHEQKGVGPCWRMGHGLSDVLAVALTDWNPAAAAGCRQAAGATQPTDPPPRTAAISC